MISVFTNHQWLSSLSFCIIFIGHLSTILAKSNGQQLTKHLLEKYNKVSKDVRPVASDEDVLRVKVGFRLDKLVDVNVPNNYIQAIVQEKYKWHDDHLQWDPRRFGGIKYTHIPSSSIWTPDIRLLNMVDVGKELQAQPVVFVDNNGSVSLTRSFIHKSYCTYDLQFFPFDTQTCHWQIGSTLYDSGLVDVYPLENSYDMLMDYLPSTEWTIQDSDVTSEKVVKYHPDSVEPFTEMKFTVKMGRDAGVYKMLLVWPALILSLLIPLMFWLAPGSTARITTGVMVLVGFIALLIYTSIGIMSQQKTKTSILVEYFYRNLFVVFTSLIMSTIVMNVYLKTERRKPMPFCVKKIFVDFLARILLIRCKINCCSKHKQLKIPHDDVPVELHDLHMTSGKYTSAGYENVDMWQEKFISNLAILNRNVHKLATICKQAYDRQYDLDLTSDWLTVALVIDRLFFIVYLITVVILFLGWRSQYPLRIQLW